MLDGRFRVAAVLGLGSATEAYVAEQVSLSRKVALKVIRPDLGVQEGLGERFDREVRRLAAVDHPGVVRVIDSGGADKLLYLVTELVEGKPLAAELSAEPLLPERAVELLTQLAEGLAAIHEKGLVHGELRPESVTLLQTARGDRVKLGDFGIARLVDAESPKERVTLVARAIGPLDYLAPEQVKGAFADAACDVYAFGVLAYRVLSGALPAVGATGQAPRPLAQAAPHLADEFRLCELVMRCLSADPKARPAANELWKKLAALPRPTEPTLFLESMQRPPELPAKPAPLPPPLPGPAPAAAVPEAPKVPPPLMPSIPMPTLTPTAAGIDPVLAQLAQGPTPPAAPAAKPSHRRMIAGLGAVAVLALGAAYYFGRSSPAREARHLVEMRQPVQALEVLNHALRKASGPADPELLALKAAAQHLTQAHQDEEATFKSLGASAPEALDPLVLAGLAEDFGRADDAGLQALLRALPAKALQGVFTRFAKEPLSSRQWGALRYLDLEHAAKGLNLVELYSISLESNNCATRKTAAKRLAQLDDDSAEQALLRLRETPREGTEKNCGQDEAAAALQALKRAR